MAVRTPEDKYHNSKISSKEYTSRLIDDLRYALIWEHKAYIAEYFPNEGDWGMAGKLEAMRRVQEIEGLIDSTYNYLHQVRPSGYNHY